jgi:hypothetical protein
MWKTICGFTDYEVSDLGKVRNTKSGKILAENPTETGYMKVNIRKDKQSYTRKVHRLVAEAYIDNPNGYEEIDHINEDKTDNRVENLRWCSRQMNLNYYSFGRTPAVSPKKVKVYESMEDMIKKTSKPVKVNGEVYRSAKEAARAICKIEEGKNADTVRKEIQRMLQGKREPWEMYGKYFIDRA